MVRREIEIDEDPDPMLTEIASEYRGDFSHAIAELVRAHQGLESFAEQSEHLNETALRSLRHRAEADFRERRTVTWEDVKANNGL